jgi:hypothetical protein
VPSANPQSLNRFSYVRGNPINLVDPSGHNPKCGPDGVFCDQDKSNDYDYPPLLPPGTGGGGNVEGSPPIDPTSDVFNGGNSEPTVELPEWNPDWAQYVSPADKLLAEQAFLHFIQDPDYFAALYADPLAWASSLEVAALEVYAGYNLGTTAQWLVLRFYSSESADLLLRAQTLNGQAPGTVLTAGNSNGLSLLFPAQLYWPGPGEGSQTINGIVYSSHALDRMMPVGLGGRGVPPLVVQNTLINGEIRSSIVVDRLIFTYENVRVIYDTNAGLVISVIKIGR